MSGAFFLSGALLAYERNQLDASELNRTVVALMPGSRRMDEPCFVSGFLRGLM